MKRVEMKLTAFKGGIHPAENKITAGMPVEKMTAPKMAIFPVSQHLGAPAKPVVKIGDRVLRGQIIAEPGGFVSVPIHSSISGEVVAIGEFPHPLGLTMTAIVVENDGLDEEIGYEEMDPSGLDADAIKKRILAGGVVGLGGATFPTHVKLSPPKEKKIDTVILNGAECEPFLTADHRLMLEQGDRILSGLLIIMRALGVERGFVGIENNKPDAIASLQELAKKHKNIEVAGLKVHYPQGAEKQLIKTLVNREVPPGGLPMDVGCVVQNVGTAAAVYDAVALGKPIMDRIVTVSGPAVKDPKNVLVRLGTPFFEVIEYCGGLSEDTAKVVMGGPMMGIAQYTLNVPVIKSTSGILAFTKTDVDENAPRACIRCGKCVNACPMGLMPNELVKAIDNKDWELAEKLNVLSCIECGSCSFSCIGRRPIIQLLKYGKAETAKFKRNREEAEKSKAEQAGKK